MKLFQVTTQLGVDFVVCGDEGDAAKMVKDYYDKRNYGFSYQRIASKVEYLASTEDYPPGNGVCDTTFGHLLLSITDVRGK